MCERLLEDTGVATLPGYAFGRPESELSLRLAFVDFDGELALRALSEGETLDEAFLNRHCSRVMEGIRAMAQWARG